MLDQLQKSILKPQSPVALESLATFRTLLLLPSKLQLLSPPESQSYLFLAHLSLTQLPLSQVDLVKRTSMLKVRWTQRSLWKVMESLKMALFLGL